MIFVAVAAIAVTPEVARSGQFTIDTGTGRVNYANEVQGPVEVQISASVEGWMQVALATTKGENSWIQPRMGYRSGGFGLHEPGFTFGMNTGFNARRLEGEVDGEITISLYAPWRASAYLLPKPGVLPLFIGPEVRLSGPIAKTLHVDAGVRIVSPHLPYISVFLGTAGGERMTWSVKYTNHF